MREPVGECRPLAVTACSWRRPTWHIREEAGKSESKPSFLSAKQVTNYNEKVTTENGKLTVNMLAMSTVHDS